MKNYVLPKIDSEEVVGTFVDKSHYDTLVDSDCDGYRKDVVNTLDESNLLFRFRKNVFSLEEQKLAYRGLSPAATPSQNRGMAAGPKGEKLGNRDWVTEFQIEILETLAREESGSLFDEDPIKEIIKKYSLQNTESTRGLVWLRSEIQKDYGSYDGFFDKWFSAIKKASKEEQRSQARKIIDKYISDTNYANAVNSGIAGYFGRYPRIPYKRATAYTEKNKDLFEMSFPFLKTLDSKFKELVPERYSNQKKMADKLDPRFRVSDTVFTTITVNKNFRTAAHRDAGDLTTGFSNLSVLTDGTKDYQGAHLVLPEYRVAIDLRPGDLLLINNHEAIHGNTELIGDKDMERISIVCYFREDMLVAGSWEYEALRRNYVDERRLNQKHKLWTKLWNGISPGMWAESEWSQYLTEHGLTDENGDLSKSKQATLEELFA